MISLLLLLLDQSANAELDYHQRWMSSFNEHGEIFKTVNYKPGFLNYQEYRDQVNSKLLFKLYANSNNGIAETFLDDFIHHPQSRSATELHGKNPKVLLMLQIPEVSKPEIYQAKYEKIFNNPDLQIVTFREVPELFQKLEGLNDEVKVAGKPYDFIELSFHGLPGAHGEEDLRKMFVSSAKDIKRNLKDLHYLAASNAEVVVSSCSYARDSFLLPSNGKVALAQLGSKLLPNGGKIYASEKVVYGGIAEHWPWFRDRYLLTERSLFKELKSFVSTRFMGGVEQFSISALYGPNPHIINYDLVEVEIPAGAKTYKDCTLSLIKSVFNK